MHAAACGDHSYILKTDGHRIRTGKVSTAAEEEIEDLNRYLNEVENAIKLDSKLPTSEKEKNSHLNNLRKDHGVQNHLGGDSLEVKDLPTLKKALEYSLKERKAELNSAKETFLKEKSSKCNENSSETKGNISSSESTENSSISNDKSSGTIEGNWLDSDGFGF